jgi:hypothetical protein
MLTFRGLAVSNCRGWPDACFSVATGSWLQFVLSRLRVVENFRFGFQPFSGSSLGVPHTALAVAAFLVRQGRRFFYARSGVMNLYM